MNLFWSIIGILSFIIGFAGMFLPLLPTTPLWLLSAFCLMKGSDKLYAKAMSYKTFNNVVTNFRIYRAIPLRIKIISVSTLWITIIISCIIVKNMWVTILLIIIATAVTTHILSFRTLSKEEQEKLRNNSLKD